MQSSAVLSLHSQSWEDTLERCTKLVGDIHRRNSTSTKQVEKYTADNATRGDVQQTKEISSDQQPLLERLADMVILLQAELIYRQSSLSTSRNTGSDHCNDGQRSQKHDIALTAEAHYVNDEMKYIREEVKHVHRSLGISILEFEATARNKLENQRLVSKCEHEQSEHRMKIAQEEQERKIQALKSENGKLQASIDTLAHMASDSNRALFASQEKLKMTLESTVPKTELEHANEIVLKLNAELRSQKQVLESSVRKAQVRVVTNEVMSIKLETEQICRSIHTSFAELEVQMREKLRSERQFDLITKQQSEYQNKQIQEELEKRIVVLKAENGLLKTSVDAITSALGTNEGKLKAALESMVPKAELVEAKNSMCKLNLKLRNVKEIAETSIPKNAVQPLRDEILLIKSEIDQLYHAFETSLREFQRYTKYEVENERRIAKLTQKQSEQNCKIMQGEFEKRIVSLEGENIQMLVAIDKMAEKAFHVSWADGHAKAVAIQGLETQLQGMVPKRELEEVQAKLNDEQMQLARSEKVLSSLPSADKVRSISAQAAQLNNELKDIDKKVDHELRLLRSSCDDEVQRLIQRCNSHSQMSELQMKACQVEIQTKTEEAKVLREALKISLPMDVVKDRIEHVICGLICARLDFESERTNLERLVINEKSARMAVLKYQTVMQDLVSKMSKVKQGLENIGLIRLLQETGLDAWSTAAFVKELERGSFDIVPQVDCRQTVSSLCRSKEAVPENSFLTEKDVRPAGKNDLPDFGIQTSPTIKLEESANTTVYMDPLPDSTIASESNASDSFVYMDAACRVPTEECSSKLVSTENQNLISRGQYSTTNLTRITNMLRDRAAEEDLILLQSAEYIPSKQWEAKRFRRPELQMTVKRVKGSEVQVSEIQKVQEPSVKTEGQIPHARAGTTLTKALTVPRTHVAQHDLRNHAFSSTEPVKGASLSVTYNTVATAPQPSPTKRFNWAHLWSRKVSSSS